MHRTLSNQVRAYRIGDPNGAFPIYSGEGSRLYPGRWNVLGQAMIYAAEHYSTALLEKLIYTGELPPRQHYIEIEIPAGTSYEVVTADILPGWNGANSQESRVFGSAWYAERRSAVLYAPSAVAPVENNILINPEHPDSERIRASLEKPVYWDRRLFGESP